MKRRTLICGILGLSLFVVSELLMFLPRGQEIPGLLAVFWLLGSFFAPVFSLIGIIKPQKTKVGIILCVLGITFSVLNYVPVVVSIMQIRTVEKYTDEYFYDAQKKKIPYVLGEGYFDYNRHNIYDSCYEGIDGEYYYDIYMDGDGDSYTYCNWLFPENENPMISLHSFFGDSLYDDDSKRCSKKMMGSEYLIFPWGKTQAYYEKSGRTIDLKVPIIHRYCDGSYETFVDTDLLYYIQYLKLYDVEAYTDYFNYLLKKDHIIWEKGDKINGEWFYKDNVISGANTHFNNNTLLADAKLKIGMTHADVVALLGPGKFDERDNSLEYERTMTVSVYNDKELRATAVRFCCNPAGVIEKIVYYSEPF